MFAESLKQLCFLNATTMKFELDIPGHVVDPAADIFQVTGVFCSKYFRDKLCASLHSMTETNRVDLPII